VGLNPPVRPGLTGVTLMGLGAGFTFGAGFTLGAEASRSGVAGAEGPAGFTVIGLGVRDGVAGDASGRTGLG
jgi:hypothetical protein